MFHNCILKLQALNKSISKLPQYYYRFEKAVLTAIDKFLDKYHEGIYIIFTDIYFCILFVFFACEFSGLLFSELAFVAFFLSPLYFLFFYMRKYYEEKKQQN